MRLALAGFLAMSGGNLLVIEYGSGRAGRDIDLLLVQDSPAVAGGIVVGQLDLFVLSWSQCSSLCRLRDPVAVEPLWSGRVVAGSTEVRDALMAESPRAVAEVVRHLYAESSRATTATWGLLGEYERTESQESLRRALQDLAFAMSYSALARKYLMINSVKSPVLLAKLESSHELALPDFWAYRDLVRSGGAQLDHHMVEGFLMAFQGHSLAVGP